LPKLAKVAKLVEQARLAYLGLAQLAGPHKQAKPISFVKVTNWLSLAK